MKLGSEMAHEPPAHAVSAGNCLQLNNYESGDDEIR